MSIDAGLTVEGLASLLREADGAHGDLRTSDRASRRGPAEYRRLSHASMSRTPPLKLQCRRACVGGCRGTPATPLIQSPDLASFTGRVSDPGEGRWILTAAIDQAVTALVLSAALYARISSRGQDDFADQMLSPMRIQFGGHQERQAAGGRPR